MSISSKRAEYTSLLGMVLSVVFFVVVWILAASSNSFAISAFKWQLLCSAIISAVLWFHFHLMSLAQQEKLEMAQINKDSDTQTIFQQDGNRLSMFEVSTKRLELFEKWFLPVMAGFIIIYQLAIGFWLVSQIGIYIDDSLNRPQATAIFMILIAFATFLIAKYATGMSEQPKWKPIRAMGSYLLSIAIVAFLIGLSMGLAQLKYTLMHRILCWIVPSLLILLGVEGALNIIFDLYRPRIPGQYHRSGFDSRLLGLINEPGGFLHSIASAIDYQFGFTVSQTWFYKLLEKAILPLIILSVILLWLMSSVVIVSPGQQAVIEHFGKPVNSVPLSPGLTFKMPWPIDIAFIEDVEQVRSLDIGYVAEEHATREPLLWGQSHHKEEENLLVAAQSSGSMQNKGAGSFSIVVTAVPIHYRLKNLYDFIYNNNDPREVLKAIAYRQLTKFAASASIETDNDDGSLNDESLFGHGRKKSAEILKQRIQKAADENNLGIEIVFIGVAGVHPPKLVAPDYQAVVSALQQKQAVVLAAMAMKNQILASLGGSVEDVYKLYNIARQYQQAKNEDDQANIDKLEKQFDQALVAAEGEIFKTLRTAKSDAFEKATLAKAEGLRFDSQLKAFAAAPDIYPKFLRLTMLERSLGNTRKYVVLTDPNDYQVLIFDLKDKVVESLYDIDVSGEGK